MIREGCECIVLLGGDFDEPGGFLLGAWRSPDLPDPSSTESGRRLVGGCARDLMFLSC